MPSFRHILTRIDKVEEAMLPERQTLVVIEDKVKGTLYAHDRKFKDETELTKWLETQPHSKILHVLASPKLIAEGLEAWKE